MGAPGRFSAAAALLTLGADFGPPPALADGEQDLAKQSQNPVGDLVIVKNATAADSCPAPWRRV